MTGMGMLNLDNQKRIVAIYGRVSTEHEAQLSALENQKIWYQNILENHPDWQLYDKYIDEGITGTQAKKRPEFLRMMEDAEAGKFDLIVTREVTRFARNTLDAINYSRKLRQQNVEVYFISDGISNMDKDGEYRFTIMAANAQEESRKTSERVKAGQYSSRLKGVIFGTGNILGYDRKDGVFVINPEQAETVRMIYRLYLEGNGLRVIKTELLREGRKNASGKVKWFESTISRVLDNPFYIGRQYQKQTEVTDFLAHTVKKNPRSEQSLIQGNHKPIISEEDYYKVAAIKTSKATTAFNQKTVGSGQPTEMWMKLLECGCGSRFHQYKWRKDERTGRVKKGYSCRHRVNNGSTEYRDKRGLPLEGACNRKVICDWYLELMAKDIFESIWGYRQETVSQLFELIKNNYVEKIDNSERFIMERESKIRKYKAKINNLIELFTDNEMVSEADRATFFQKKAEFEGFIKLAEADIKGFKQKSRKDETSLETKLAHIKEKLNSMIDFDAEKLDRNMISRLLDKVIVRNDNEFEWYMNLTDTQNADVFSIAPNEEISKKRDKSIEARDTRYKLLFESVISFDRARAYRKQYGMYLRQNQWTDLSLKLYVR